jgi:hypothetical protein
MIASSEIATLQAQLPPLEAALTVSFLTLGVAARWIVFTALRKEKAAVFGSVLRGYLGAIRSREPSPDGDA